MPLIIKQQQVVEDSWQQLPADCSLEQALASELPLVPLSLWQQQRSGLAAKPQLGIWLDSHEIVEDIAADLDAFAVIALNFPSFTDGRHFSSARLLRERYGYRGEIRAIGDVLRDQLFYLQRCGFDAFAIRADRCPHDALAGLTDFSLSDQAAVDQPEPLVRRRSA